MLACSQFYTGNCYTVDVTPVSKLSMEVEDLLGYECSQVAMATNIDQCAMRNETCEGVLAVLDCFQVYYAEEDPCRLVYLILVFKFYAKWG